MGLNMKNIQIVMLSDLSPSGGGRETWISQFVPKFLKVHDVKFEVCSIGTPRSDSIIQSGQSVSVESVWPWRRLAPWPLLFMAGYLYSSAVRKRSIDVVVAVGGLSEAAPIMLSNLLFRRKSRCVLWLRTVYMKEKAPRIPRIIRGIVGNVEKILIRRFDAVIANGKDTASFYQKYRDDIVVIENAVDIDRWRVSRKHYAGGPIHISFIGRVTDIKGIREFIRAVTIFKSKNKLSAHFRFTVLGACTESIKNEFGLVEPNCGVEYIGPLPNHLVPDFLKSVDVCVNLTYGTGEFMGGGVSNALLEQMAAGKPQIVWDNPIYRNVADEGFALFARERDVDSLVVCLEKLWHIRQSLPDMSNFAMIRAQDFGWDHHISRASDVFFCNGPPSSHIHKRGIR